MAVVYPSSSLELVDIVKIGKTKNCVPFPHAAPGALSSKKSLIDKSQRTYIANGLGGENGTLVIDMAKFTDITVDPSTMTAVIETGNRLGDIALALNNYGLAMPHGTCPYVRSLTCLSRSIQALTCC